MELASEPSVEPQFCFVLEIPHETFSRLGKGTVGYWLLNNVLHELGWDWYFRESGHSIELFPRP